MTFTQAQIVRTPGPWAISSTGSVVSASGGYVAEAYDGLPGTDTDLGIAAANAALIAAAPALYEALKVIVGMHANFSDAPEWTKARAALSAAKKQD